jgi:hypothetical protein
VYDYIRIICSNVFVFENDVYILANIANSLFLLRLSFVGDLIMALSYLLTAWALYNSLKDFDKNLSLLFLLLTTVSVAVLSNNMINYFAIIETNQAEYLTQNIKSTTQFFFNIYNAGYYSSQIYFGLWLLPLGIVVLKSKIMPAYFGIMLIAATFGHLIEFFVTFLYPEGKIITYPGLFIAMIGEFSFCFWLLFKGIKTKMQN